MPFDSLGTTIETQSIDDPLERLDITPVPAKFVKAYMKKYRDDFIARRPPGPGPFVWRRFLEGDVIKYMPQTSRTLTLMLAVATSVHERGASFRTEVPAEVTALGERVKREVPGARFSVDYFDQDPVLSVTYPVGSDRREACLAIWDKGEIKAIAETGRRAREKAARVPAPMAPSERRGLFATLFGGRSAAEL